MTDDLLSRCRFPSPEGGPVTLAVSGGPDSMALLVLASRAGLVGKAIHVDHGLRPESPGEAAVVAAAAGRFGFDFEAVEVDVPPGPDVEARARAARYAALPAGVMTGHTMDDQAETVLLNVLRGAALDGLCGMRPNERVRRPLLGLRRRETAEVCREAGFEPVVDPTNSDLRFRRNRVRLEVIPLLSEVAERDVVPILARQADAVDADVALLEQLASGLDPTDARSLSAAPVPLARRAVRRWLRSGDRELHPPSFAEVDRVLQVATGLRKACEVTGGRRVARSSGRLTVGGAR